MKKTANVNSNYNCGCILQHC